MRKNLLLGGWHEGCTHLACVYQWSEVSLPRLSMLLFFVRRKKKKRLEGRVEPSTENKQKMCSDGAKLK
jgi:hypothetical protein